ncbi:hypothetical protein C4B24_00770 [Mycoplasma marinum]|uniref:Uncharacterized protein n=1 Tax=Mycoplasma marinum TaxID=1937190 RepID=A0A4R0XVU7_9MOLU|nr:hypothetical protein C4B24_00770 [Mycoplasma marinum]
MISEHIQNIIINLFIFVSSGLYQNKSNKFNTSLKECVFYTKTYSKVINKIIWNLWVTNEITKEYFKSINLKETKSSNTKKMSQLFNYEIR